MVSGILAAVVGGDFLPGLASVLVYLAVVALTRVTEGRWFLRLCAGCLVAVAAGLTSPVFAVVVMLLVLANAGIELDLFATARERWAYLTFSVLLLLFAVPLAAVRHAVLPLTFIALVVLVGGGVVAISWARTLWKAQKGDL